ncbi:hypothetical protein SESBI_13996 [Sesbania bispinosa]|nr:hypothetical protein SESBI_13996 [Sesbania bispinosa]
MAFCLVGILILKLPGCFPPLLNWGPHQLSLNGKPNSSESKSDTTETPIPPGAGRGHGRGKPNPPPSGFPSFSSFMSSIKQPPAGCGRATGLGALPPEHDLQPPDSGSKKPIFFKREDVVSLTATDDLSHLKKPFHPRREDVASPTARSSDHENDNQLPGSILGVLSGLGRGKPMKQADPETPVTEKNRHIRTLQAPGATASSETARETFGRGRGRGVGRGGFSARDIDERIARIPDAEDSNAAGLYVGDDAHGERLAKKFGPEIMNQLTEGFEEMANRVLPSPLEDEYLEALDINCAIEFEPEYLMGEFLIAIQILMRRNQFHFGMHLRR